MLGEKIPITNGEAFAIVRANRDLRNLKCLPHFHMQSICSSSTTGSSAQQALRQKHMFQFRHQNSSDELRSALVGSTSLIADGQVHNAVAHTEVRVLRYLRREKADYGPSSLLLSHVSSVYDYANEGNPNPASASTSLAAAEGVEGSFVPGVPDGSSGSPSPFHFQNTNANVARLSTELSEATVVGQKRTQRLLSALKVRAFSAQGLLDLVKQAIWKSKLRVGLDGLVDQSDPSVVDLEGTSYLPSSSMAVRKLKSVSDATLASAVAAFLGHTTNEEVSASTLKTITIPIETLCKGESESALLSGLHARPSTLRDLMNIRAEMTAVAHVAAVVPDQVAAISQLASILVNLAMSTHGDGVVKEVARRSQQHPESHQGTAPTSANGRASKTTGAQPVSALPHPMVSYRSNSTSVSSPYFGPSGTNFDEASQSPPPSFLNEADFGDVGTLRDEVDAVDAVLLNLFCTVILDVFRMHIQ